MSWYRLSARLASARGPAGRVEEDGLRIWQGHDENAFRPMRECCRELNSDPQQCRITDRTDAVEPACCVGLAEPLYQAGW